MDNIDLKKFAIPIVVLVIGIVIFTLFIKNPDEAKKRPQAESKGFLVEVKSVEFGNYPIKVEAMGQIAPAMEVELKPQISGEILSIEGEFIPGGFFKTDEPILYIDPEDYKIAKQKQEAVFSQAEADFKLEMGRQSVAKNELDILAKTTGKKLDNPALALRAPQLSQAKAELQKAKSDLNMAELNLSRAVIKAPFNALITSRNTTIGDKVTPQTSLATLVNTDEYWVKISVPIHSLQWLNIPKGDDYTLNFVDIIMDSGRGKREGYLLKMIGTLDTQSRLADMLVAIPDPLLLTQKETNLVPLILGDYVKVVIAGKTLENSVRIPISWLRDDNILWLFKDGKLFFQKVEPVYEDRDYVYIKSGLAEGDIVITSDIPVPIGGMKIRISGGK